ncbi:hypothetical protein Q3G72_035410 [Acer saccharum]|nr:hypothetical protein Q3G72_035410 [Acer saccharum]
MLDVNKNFQFCFYTITNFENLKITEPRRVAGEHDVLEPRGRSSQMTFVQSDEAVYEPIKGDDPQAEPLRVVESLKTRGDLNVIQASSWKFPTAVSNRTPSTQPLLPYITTAPIRFGQQRPCVKVVLAAGNLVVAGNSNMVKIGFSTPTVTLAAYGHEPIAKLMQMGTENVRPETVMGALYCSVLGEPPYTLAEYSISGSSDADFFDISLVDGFNVPMEFRGTSSKCSKVIKCVGDINGLCPSELRHSGTGCYHPCTVFKNKQFCCDGGPESCNSTEAYFKFFKDLCPNVYTYPYDDETSMFTCPTGTDYKSILMYKTTAATRFGQPPCLVVAGNSNLVINGFSALTLTSTAQATYGHEPIANEYAFRAFNNLDIFDITLLDGFNVPMEFRGTSIECTKVIKCVGDINGLCPIELRHSGGCYHPCDVFKNKQFCCNERRSNCDSTEAYFKFFKDLCPNV